jgi:hypothetical protein
MEFISEKEAIRHALLKAESKWQGEVDIAETMTQRTIARVIADAFHQEADEYKTTKETVDHGKYLGSSAWDDELGEAPAFPHEG